MTKPILSLEDHKEICVSIQKIRSEFAFIFGKIQPIAVTSSASKTYFKSLKQLEELRHKLDVVFHKLIDDEMFKAIGHIYYPNEAESTTSTEMPQDELIRLIRAEFEKQVLVPLIERLVKTAIEKELKPGGILYDR